MSILVGNNTRLIIQGITGKEGSFHGEQIQDYGTNLVAGVTPGKGGQKDENGIPIFPPIIERYPALLNTSCNSSTVVDFPFEPVTAKIFDSVNQLANSISLMIGILSFIASLTIFFNMPSFILPKTFSM